MRELYKVIYKLFLEKYPFLADFAWEKVAEFYYGTNDYIYYINDLRVSIRIVTNSDKKNPKIINIEWCLCDKDHPSFDDWDDHNTSMNALRMLVNGYKYEINNQCVYCAGIEPIVKSKGIEVKINPNFGTIETLKRTKSKVEMIASKPILFCPKCGNKMLHG